MTPSDAPDLSEARIAEIERRLNAINTSIVWHKGLFAEEIAFDCKALLSALRDANARAEGLAEALTEARAVLVAVIGDDFDVARLARIDAALKEMPDGK